MEISELYKRLDGETATFSTDTRTIQKDDIYIALKGEVFNGNAFVKDSLNKGARFAIVDDPAAVQDEKCILVENTFITLQGLARHHRSTFIIPVLAVGGSNGKTTTKELVHAVLNTKFKTHTTKGNLNNDIGVPLTILAMKKEVEIAVIEIGANHPGEHLQLLDIISPTHVLVTNNGADHLEGFGSLEGVRAANKEIFDWAKEHNVHAFVNKNLDDLVEDSENLSRTLYPTEETQSVSQLFASVSYKDSIFKSQLFGSFNETNLVAAITVGEYFNAPLNTIQTAVERYIPTLKRSQVIETKECTIILDCYNANPTSTELAVKDFFSSIPSDRILLIGDMLELGSTEYEEHKKILDLLQVSSTEKDLVLCVGPRFFTFNKQFPFHFFENTFDAKMFLDSTTLEKKTLFLKASRGIKLEEVIKEKLPA